jgi:hypothetical protein
MVAGATRRVNRPVLVACWKDDVCQYVADCNQR